MFLRELEATPERARHLLTAHWCASEISNGGFQQFFAGAAGVMAPEAAAGLRALGLADSAAVLDRAMALPGPAVSRARSPGATSAEEAGGGKRSPFTALDDEFLRSLQARPGGFDAVAASYARGLSPWHACPVPTDRMTAARHRAGDPRLPDLPVRLAGAPGRRREGRAGRVPALRRRPSPIPG